MDSLNGELGYYTSRGTRRGLPAISHILADVMKIVNSSSHLATGSGHLYSFCIWLLIILVLLEIEHKMKRVQEHLNVNSEQ